MTIRTLLNIELHLGRFSLMVGIGPLLAPIFGVAFVTGVLFGQDTSEIKEVSQPKGQSAAATPSSPQLEAVVARARERAKLLHDVYSATLDAIHHHYFRREGSAVPARAMEDVFQRMAALSGTTANWISVNTKAMSIDHEPSTAFEKTAAAELSAGKEAYEVVGKHVYRRATSIPLGTNCIGCHTGMFSDPPKSPRFAGLVISIPLIMEKK